MRIGTYNIDGLLGSEHEVATLMSKHQLDVLALQETWVRNEETDGLPNWITCSVSAPVPRGALRGFGGAAIVVSPALRHRVVATRGTQRYQFAITLVGDIHVASVYISPHAVKAEVLDCLNAVKRMAPPPAVIVGDLNARHADWDTRGNYRGALLKVWAKESRFSIKAPEHPTFYNYNGSSTVDISLLKQCSLSHITAAPEIREVSNGHIPIVFHIDKDASLFNAPQRIPHGRRRNEFCNDMAQHFYARAFPLLATKFQECSTPVELDDAFRIFCETFECPWVDQGHQPERFRHFWSRDLEKMARNRDKLRANAAGDNTEAAWIAYRSANRLLKRAARREKRRRAQESFRAAAYANPGKANSLLATALKNSRQQSVTAEDKERLLNPDEFTRYMISQCLNQDKVPAEKFAMNRSMQNAVRKALALMKADRATGLDNVFAEGLQLVPIEASELISALWEAIGRINYSPPQFREAELVPLHKKGSRETPANYRPIALISHVRKVLDKALDILTREEYVFQTYQIGFRSKMGTENAILRATDAIDSGYKYVACLDLKGAYDAVPRLQLMRRLRRVLSHNLCNMISHTLQPTSVTTRGSVSNVRGLLYSGVQQGSPASPTLFNVYIDELVEDILRYADFDVSRAAILYADDVLLCARSRCDLQKLLNIASRWAARAGMIWNTSKSFILSRPGVAEQFYLAGDLLDCKHEIEYLGVTLTLDGVVESGTVNRIRNAQAKWTSALCLEKRVGLIPPTTAVTLFKTVIRPLTEYGLQFCPISLRVLQAYETLEARLFRKVLWQVSLQDKPRARKLLRLPSISERRCKLITSMRARIELKTKTSQANTPARELQMRKVDNTIMQRWFAKQGRPPETTADTIHQSWRRLCAHHRRRIPNPRRGPIPALTLRNAAARDRATRYYFVRFPCMRREVVRARLRELGECASQEERMRTLLDKAHLEAHEKACLERAIIAIRRCERRQEQAQRPKICAHD